VRFLVAALIAVAPALASAKPVPRWQQLPLPPAMPAPSSDGFVERDGVQLYFATFGSGDPVVLLHGGMGNSDHWAHQVPELAKRFRVIVIDSRGQGRSTRTTTKPTYDLMATDVTAVLDHLAVERAAFVGWSDGGEIALKLAIHHPRRVTRLFVFGSHYDEKGTKPRKGPRSTTFTKYTAKCRADYQRLSKTPKQFDQMVKWLSPIWREPMGFSKDQLRGIKVPAVISVGEHDEIVARAQVEEMAELIPGARLEVLAGVSHFGLWQDPEGFGRVLAAFLAPVAAAPSDHERMRRSPSR
jgi:pimeloyl-ACP methyl ester carboxylesterase